MPLPNGIVCFLFTDIEGSTRLWEEHPEEMPGALAGHDRLLDQIIPERGGHVFKRVGDAFCAVFARPQDAARAALDAQHILHRQVWAGGLNALRVRIALHHAEAQQRGDDYFGSPLNRLARLLAVGHGGQILLSQAACEALAGDLPAEAFVRDLAMHRLKDLGQPEHVFQLCHPTLPIDFPPLRSLHANNLPLQTSSFVGRDWEIAEVKRRLAAGRLVTLTGSPGCGKTRLALQAAAETVDSFPDGAWLAGLAPLEDPDLIPQTVATALGVREEPARPLIETLAAYLQPRTLLLLLDNCEHLLDGCAHLSEFLLERCPKLRILATSREPLAIRGEASWPVRPLSLPGGRSAPLLEQIAACDAVRLLLDRAAAMQPAFTLSAGNAHAVVQICRRLDGIPLAIELAAARVKALSIEQVAHRMDDRFRLLTQGSRTALPRQQTLRAVIDWSYDLLSEPERLLLRRLSVFSGGWTLDAAEAVCAGEEVAPEDVLDLLSRLVDKSLVIAEEGAGAARYRLLETLRQYGEDRLTESGSLERIRARHRVWFLALAEEAERHEEEAEHAVWLDRLETEHENFRTALESCRAAAPEAEIRLAAALQTFWYVRGYLSEGLTYLQRALVRREGAPPSVCVEALNGAGILSWAAGDYGAAQAFYSESLEILRAGDSKNRIAAALNNLGSLMASQGAWEDASPYLEESLALYRELGKPFAIATVANNLGGLRKEQGAYEAAHALLSESLALLEHGGHPAARAWTLHNLGELAARQGDLAAADVYLEESFRIRRTLGDKQGLAMLLLAWAMLRGRQQRDEEAAEMLGQAECLREAASASFPPTEQQEYQAGAEALRARLGGDSFDRRWKKGYEQASNDLSFSL